MFEQRHFYAFIMQLTVEERVFILESNLKTKSYAHCRQSFFEKFRILKINITRAVEEVNERTLRKVAKLCFDFSSVCC
jgi:site-specific DNA-adenine methylase